jgi:hypothetical protein
MRCTQKGNDRRLERHPRTVKPGRSPIPLGTTGHSGLGAGDYSSPAPMLLNGAVKVNAGSSALNPILSQALRHSTGIAASLGPLPGSWPANINLNFLAR